MPESWQRTASPLGAGRGRRPQPGCSTRPPAQSLNIFVQDQQSPPPPTGEEEKIRWRQKQEKLEGRRRGVRSRESLIHHKQAKCWLEVMLPLSIHSTYDAPEILKSASVM